MKILNREIKGIIFDLDGTLFDSCGMWHEIDVQFFKKRGMEFPEDYGQKIAHLGLDKAAVYTIETYHLNETPEELKSEWKQGAIDAYTNDVYIKPNVYEYLTMLKEKGIKLGIATANSKEFYMPALIHNRIDHFFDYICDVNEFKGSKENPEIYYHVQRGLGVDVENCAVFEDIPTALETAFKAGFLTIAVDDEHEKNLVDAKKKVCHLFIKDYKELIKD